MPGVLVDTNVLVYAHDRGEFAKQARAIEVLEALRSGGAGILSVQSLGEFFSIATRGRRPLLTLDQAAKQVDRLVAGWPVLNLTPLVVAEATRAVRTHKLAYWDAQLWATARLNQVPVIFSEDFSVGSILEGVRFVNPFSPDFDLEPWT